VKSGGNLGLESLSKEAKSTEEWLFFVELNDVEGVVSANQSRPVYFVGKCLAQFLIKTLP